MVQERRQPECAEALLVLVFSKMLISLFLSPARGSLVRTIFVDRTLLLGRLPSAKKENGLLRYEELKEGEEQAL